MIKKKKLVWISPYLPYPSVNHAGGKTQNFYLSKIIEAKGFDVRLIGFYNPKEIERFVLDKKIKCTLFCYHSDGIKKMLRNLHDFNYLKNPYHRYANFTTRYIESNIVKTLKKYKKEGYNPAVIILEWTQTVLFIGKVKNIFPEAKIVGIEEDVTLLSFKRRIDIANTDRDRRIARIKFKNIEKAEIQALNMCDLIICNNNKDEKILKQYKIEVPIRIWSAFFEKSEDIHRHAENSRDVLFYGAMSRAENYLSAQWLLDNVKPLLEGKNIRFIILGGYPPQFLQEYASDDVVITGFVDNINPYFEKALCLAAPLVLGAGIKVKILEAMCSGIPVMTNDIGIEGIPAIEGEEYYYCKDPEQFANKIIFLSENNSIAFEIGQRAKAKINSSFNYERDAKEFIECVFNL